VTEQIAVYKKMIEEKFNPVSYREHLKNVFAVEIKNEIMQKNLSEASKRVSKIEIATQKYERFLEKTNSLVIIGRTHDSPAGKRGKIQKRLEEERRSSLTSRSHTRQFSLGSMGQSGQKSRPFSPASLTQSKIELDLTKVGHSSTKTSLKTTDRSHFKQKSDVSKQLF
jgi:DNA-binding SARP family transcriptional activator